jgi:hypothetical protein
MQPADRPEEFPQHLAHGYYFGATPLPGRLNGEPPPWQVALPADAQAKLLTVHLDAAGVAASHDLDVHRPDGDTAGLQLPREVLGEGLPRASLPST